MTRLPARSRVLIVDDEPGFSRALGKRLALRGFDSDLALDGKTALARLRDGTYLAVLLDLRLPDIPGLEVLLKLRAWGSDLPVLIITAHGGDSDREECLAGGAELFLTKPVDVDEITQYLDAYQAGAS